MSELSEYIASLSLDQGMSIRELAALAEISPQTALRAVKGIGRVSDETLERIAAKLPGADLGVMRRKREGAQALTPFEVPREFDRLSYRERRVVLAVGRQLLISSGKLEADSPSIEDQQNVIPAELGGGSLGDA